MIQGKVIKYKDNIDTDVIIPARYLNTSDPKELSLHCMEDLDKDFGEKVKSSNIMVAGKNFGCGSSREHAPIAIKASGIKCIVAETFSRIFYRNSINIGLPIIECKEASKDIDKNDEIIIDFKKGYIKNITKDKNYAINPFPPFMQKIIESEGLINYIKNQNS
ncbi:3-isopropylmalate dehydratase small subunit [Clostridium oceanicum]|uniref:3-isopropylmalate dehydratase small subunit n=1 Tax=Clostridium oceanicum TaxID=1543 RepID=A0ABN1J9A7_9CLOT